MSEIKEMMSVVSLDDILTEQSIKLEQLTMATLFLKDKKDIMHQLIEIQHEVFGMKKSLDTMQKDLEKMKQQNVHCRELSSMIETLIQRLTHMAENVPEQLIPAFQNIEQSNANSLQLSNEDSNVPNMINKFSNSVNVTEDRYDENNENRVLNCKKILFDEPEVYRSIKLLTQQEFNKIPRYIIGRQSLEAVNNLVMTINQILKAKYTLLSLGKNGARKKGVLDLYLHYRKQETIEQGKMYFFTSEDYERQTKSKLDKMKLNLLTALRHCKRLREMRVAKTLQYIVVQ
ncbi:spindle and kinetochore-associated protein 1 isoform X2 [Cephus cinctus]|uniref:SKA complex subunit 1 n=1 Tax=Cephus cinctus TaxID=211228 RepID=A0AAJ7BGN1_CEPCN|nr:spindle and kinetochore-associated protein 1 isoform X2 [Cephus cinctus]